MWKKIVEAFKVRLFSLPSAYGLKKESALTQTPELKIFNPEKDYTEEKIPKYASISFEVDDEGIIYIKVDATNASKQSADNLGMVIFNLVTSRLSEDIINFIMEGKEDILIKYKNDIETYAKIYEIEAQKQLDSPMIHPMNTFRQSNA